MTDTEERVPVDFGDLLIAVADDLDQIRQCIGCGADSTWAGLYVDEQSLVSVSAWCDAPACEHDRVVMSAEHVLALPINHLPGLRRRPQPQLGEPCDQCGPGYRIGDDGCRHGAAAMLAPVRVRLGEGRARVEPAARRRRRVRLPAELVKALTVQQPWAWAIVHGGKDVENRTQAWTHRGPLAIHAGARISARGLSSPLVNDALLEHEVNRERWWWVTSAIVGTVDVVDAHVAEPGCCESPWAETSYDEHGGRTRRDVAHLVHENPRALAEAIPCRGQLGLWTPPADVLEQLEEAISA